MRWTWVHRLGSPPHIYCLAKRLTPWFAWSAGILMLAGLSGALLFSPPDNGQGESFRIACVHAPCAWVSLFIFATMAAASAAGLIWRKTVAYALAASCAPVGASFTAAALLTGMFWGRPFWGTYWAWSPLLTAELILLFLYLGYIGLRAAFDDTQRADRASAILAIVGIVDVPIVHFSVNWWNSLNRGASVLRLGKPTIALPMLIPLSIMFVGFTLFVFAILAVRLRGEVLRRERTARWLREVLA